MANTAPSAPNKADVSNPLPAPTALGGEREPIPLSAVNQYLFCPRRAALIHIEGIFLENEHTLRGDIVHEHTDLSGFETVPGAVLLRALPVWSERLRLTGKCDVVEVRLRPGTPRTLEHPLSTGSIAALYPVEFKLGRRRRFENDDAQLCAQAMCLEEMFGIPVERGAVFHAQSKRRREVEFTPALRARTEAAIRELHALLAPSETSSPQAEIPLIPPAVWRPACQECSLVDICLPKLTAHPERIVRASQQLFETSHLKSQL